MAVLLSQTDVKTLRMPENAPIFLASLTNCWGVHNRKQFLNIINQKLIKEPFISLLYNTSRKPQGKDEKLITPYNVICIDLKFQLFQLVQAINYLKIHHGNVPMQWNFILAKILHQLLFLVTKIITESLAENKH